MHFEKGIQNNNLTCSCHLFYIVYFLSPQDGGVKGQMVRLIRSILFLIFVVFMMTQLMEDRGLGPKGTQLKLKEREREREIERERESV